MIQHPHGRATSVGLAHVHDAEAYDAEACGAEVCDADAPDADVHDEHDIHDVRVVPFSSWSEQHDPRQRGQQALLVPLE